MFSKTRMDGISVKFWKTMPMPRWRPCNGER